MPRPGFALRAMLVLAVAACVAVAWLLSGTYRPAPPPVEPLPVASSDDVEILHIEGEDVPSIVVGRLPLDGVLVLAEPGEVEIERIERALGDSRMPTVRADGRRPMVWAYLDTEDE